MTHYTTIPAPFGSYGFAATDVGVCRAVMSARTPEQLAETFHDATNDPSLCLGLQDQLRDYFGGHQVKFDIAVDLSNVTPFQARVLKACQRIKYGQTATYGQLAQQVGSPNAARAVGQAMARNPIPLIIPCHRVLASNGKLTGFTAEQGVELKRWLLDLESEEGHIH